MIDPSAAIHMQMTEINIDSYVTKLLPIYFDTFEPVSTVLGSFGVPTPHRPIKQPTANTNRQPSTIDQRHKPQKSERGKQIKPCRIITAQTKSNAAASRVIVHRAMNQVSFQFNGRQSASCVDCSCRRLSLSNYDVSAKIKYANDENPSRERTWRC